MTSAAAMHLFNALRHSLHASPATRARVAQAIRRYRALLAFRAAIGV